MHCITFLILLLCHDYTEPIPGAPPPRQKLTNYLGEVMSVGKDYITIRGKEETDKAGEAISRTFSIGDELLKGKQDPRERCQSDYRLTDVSVGDIVYIVLHRSGGDVVCTTVRIRRRPGGEVPRAPFEEPDSRDPYHEAMNAYQRFEEKGVPLPLKYNLDFQRAVSAEERAVFEKQLAKLKHEDRMRLEGRIAPMPRPVVRK